MKKLQKTIKQPAEIEGVGLFTGKSVKLRLLPAPPDTGIVFIRVDLPTCLPPTGRQAAEQSDLPTAERQAGLPNHPRIPATIENVQVKLRRTAVVKEGVEVETVEHLFSALNGLGIDNLEIEINSQEIPVTDGSSKLFVELLKQAEIVEQDAPKKVIAIHEPISITESGATLAVLPTEAGLTISYTLNYDDTVLGFQHFTTIVNEKTFAEDISPARTFCLKSEADSFLAQGLGKGATHQNTLVIGSEGVIETELRFKDEFVRHKILDLIGDLSFLNASLKAHVVGIKSGHATNIKLVKKILQSLEEPETQAKKKETLLDVQEIYKILPHRYPMLLIDKVIELDGYKRAVGIKNVTANEPFFQGHFPGQPVMPGVLQIEAMAQLAGVLLMRQARSQNVKKMPVLLSLDGVKLRKTVVPGDQLRIEVEAVKIKSRTGEVYTKATVEGELVAEAMMKFMLIDIE